MPTLTATPRAYWAHCDASFIIDAIGDPGAYGKLQARPTGVTLGLSRAGYCRSRVEIDQLIGTGDGDKLQVRTVLHHVGRDWQLCERFVHLSELGAVLQRVAANPRDF